MNEPSWGDEIGEVESAHGERAGSAKRRSPTPVRESTPEQRFNELLLTITSMIGAISSMQQQLNRHLGEHLEPKRRITPPLYARENRVAFRHTWEDKETPRLARDDRGTPHLAKGDRESPRLVRNDRDELSEENREDWEPSMRSKSLRDRKSMHHGSPIRSKPTFMRSQSYRAQHGTNPLIGRYLEEDMGRLEEQLVIPKPSKPMFVQRSDEETKGKSSWPFGIKPNLQRIFQLGSRAEKICKFQRLPGDFGVEGKQLTWPMQLQHFVG